METQTEGYKSNTKIILSLALAVIILPVGTKILHSLICRVYGWCSI